MDSRLTEQQIGCPYCGEMLSITIDLSAGGQSYIEDCRVCCQPMQISFETDGVELLHVQADCAQ